METIIQLSNGWSLRSYAGSNVRLCEPNGAERLYWDSNEWHEDPKGVMLAIFKAATMLPAGIDPTTYEPLPADNPDSVKLPAETVEALTSAERKHIEVYNGYGVPVDWFVGHRRDNGDIEVLAVGHNRDDDEGRGFVWSLLINGDECSTSEAPLGPFTTGLEI